MEISPLDTSDIEAFVAYCHHHIREHDDSFVDDLNHLPSEEYPAGVLWHHGEVVGAVCLVRTAPFRQARKGRFMIFHTSQPGSEPYAMLLDHILPTARDLDFVYGFIPLTLSVTAHLWEKLGFYVERRSYVLRFDDPGTPESSLPAGFRCQPLLATDNTGIEDLCALLNRNFANQAGHVSSTTDKIRQLLVDPAYLPGGIMLLYDGSRPIGTLGLSVESTEPDTAFIEMLSVHSEYRGHGLGRALLREGIRISRVHGYSAAELSVSAENAAAVGLYLSEGFRQKQVMLCYRLNLPVKIV